MHSCLVILYMLCFIIAFYINFKRQYPNNVHPFIMQQQDYKSINPIENNLIKYILYLTLQRKWIDREGGRLSIKWWSNFNSLSLFWDKVWWSAYLRYGCIIAFHFDIRKYTHNVICIKPDLSQNVPQEGHFGKGTFWLPTKPIVIQQPTFYQMVTRGLRKKSFWKPAFATTYVPNFLSIFFFFFFEMGCVFLKKSLMSWVIVTPKERWARVAASILLLVWDRLSKKKKKCKKLVSDQKNGSAHPSFGMTTTQFIRDLLTPPKYGWILTASSSSSSSSTVDTVTELNLPIFFVCFFTITWKKLFCNFKLLL